MRDNQYKKPIIVDRIISLDELCRAVNLMLEKENRPANITLTCNNFKHYFDFYQENVHRDLQEKLSDYKVYMRFYIAECLPR